MGGGISETASKKRRGRPKVMDADYQRNTAAMWGLHLTVRTIQDRDYAMRTLNVLGGVTVERLTKYPRLFPGPEIFRWSLLAELGRLDDDETIREFAKQFNNSSLSVKEAVVRIRAYRTGKEPKADPLRLANILIDAVNRYRRKTGCDWPDVMEAIDVLKRACESAAE